MNEFMILSKVEEIIFNRLGLNIRHGDIIYRNDKIIVFLDAYIYINGNLHAFPKIDYIELDSEGNYVLRTPTSQEIDRKLKKAVLGIERKDLSPSHKITLGTKEWSDYSVNCVNGCSNNCRYCYAKKMAIRFGRKTESTWALMEIREKEVNKRYRKRKGRFMFPTAHDITPDPEIMKACFMTLKHILEPGNEVLVTTKPHPVVIKKLCSNFEDFKSQIQFRFTITSNDDNLLGFWEPGAPSYKQRLESLKFAYKEGFRTSISIEPFLSDPTRFIDDLIPYTTESIWIGIMNYIKVKGIKENEEEYYQKIRELNEPDNLFRIYLKVIENPLVRIKDAFMNKLIRAHLRKPI